MKKEKKKERDMNKWIKTILAFLCYFIYSRAFTSLFGNTTGVNFIADVIFLIFIFLAYKKNLKEDLENLKKKYSVGKIIKTILLWVIILFVFNIAMGALTELLAPNATFDDNTKAIRSLFNIDAYYTIFKTMIFAVIAEELLFRESVHDVIKNKWAFILVSSLIYTIINFIYTGFTDSFLIISILSYFLPALLFSYAYYKNNCNIFILMLIKFTYQLIPLTILLLGLGN